MRLKKGMNAPPFDLSDILGRTITSDSLLGKRYMLSFYRYASCPFCNLRVSFLTDIHKSLGLDDQFIGIFQSTEADMKSYVAKQELEFPIVSDYERIYYKKYGIESSAWAYFKGALRLDLLWKAARKGFHISQSMGPKTTIPADFLIDENGVVKHAYYGKNITDHLDLEIVEAFFK